MNDSEEKIQAQWRLCHAPPSHSSPSREMPLMLSTQVPSETRTWLVDESPHVTRPCPEMNNGFAFIEHGIVERVHHPSSDESARPRALFPTTPATMPAAHTTPRQAKIVKVWGRARQGERKGRRCYGANMCCSCMGVKARKGVARCPLPRQRHARKKRCSSAMRDAAMTEKRESDDGSKT